MFQAVVARACARAALPGRRRRAALPGRRRRAALPD
jgi:hypothetical protein